MKITNGPASNISMAFMPNACDGPHLGHLYSLLLSRFVYLHMVCDIFAKEQNAPQHFNDNVMPICARFYLCVDDEHCHAIDDYIKMIEWLGWDDVILFRNDLANYDRMYKWTCNKIEHNTVKDKFNAIERRIMFFNWAGVYRHYRGDEMRTAMVMIDEPTIARHLSMRLPMMIYHPTILNEEGVKIEGDDSDYCIKDIFDRPALDVIKWFVNWLCPRHKEEDKIMLYNLSNKDCEIYRQIWRLSGPDNHPVPSRINERIPRTWKDNIKNSN